jgi:NADH:ubiquinone oxidoreductase subunit 4 (subunit M)
MGNPGALAMLAVHGRGHRRKRASVFLIFSSISSFLFLTVPTTLQSGANDTADVGKVVQNISNSPPTPNLKGYC